MRDRLDDVTRADGWPDREYTDFHWYRDQKTRLKEEAERYVGAAGQAMSTIWASFQAVPYTHPTLPTIYSA